MFWQVDVCYPKAAEFLCMKIGEGVSENALESLKKMRIDGLMRAGRVGTIFGIYIFMNNCNFEIVIRWKS